MKPSFWLIVARDELLAVLLVAVANQFNILFPTIRSLSSFHPALPVVGGFLFGVGVGSLIVWLDWRVTGWRQ